jgi:hypothetical protein
MAIIQDLNPRNFASNACHLLNIINIADIRIDLSFLPSFSEVVSESSSACKPSSKVR